MAESKKHLDLQSDDSKTILAHLLKDLPIAAYICDQQGLLSHFNEAAVLLWGVEPEIGKARWCGSWKIYYADYAVMELKDSPMAVFLRGGDSESAEEIIIERPNGTRFNIQPHLQYVQDSFGKNIGVVNVLNDITKLRKTEQKLLEISAIHIEDEKLFKKDIEKSTSYGLHLEKVIAEKTGQLKQVTKDLASQQDARIKRAEELLVANQELVFQNSEKGKRAAELVIANAELSFQSEEKSKRASELLLINIELALGVKRAAELMVTNEDLNVQNREKDKRSSELIITNGELAFQNGANGKRAAQLIVANEELAFQNGEKEKRAAELAIANRELIFQNSEKEKRAAELIVANGELAFQNAEKGKRAAELIIANGELAFQNGEKEKRASELIIANLELAFQSGEKGKRAAELIIANTELAFQNQEKENRAAELSIANKELAFQNEEKGKRAAELTIINQELEAFSYVSSHDLQEPLRKIQTLSTRILESEGKNLSDSGKDYFKRLESAAARMRILIDDLLSFSHLNISERKFENVSLMKIVDEVKEELKETMEEKRVVIEAVNLNEVHIIPFQFRQIMHNLISNAIKFSRPEYPPRIIIKSAIVKGSTLNEGALNEDEYCHISVSDNGIGFSQEYKDRIFEVFKRLHSREEYAGTGIGLSIVKKVVQNHNGLISATGEPGNGATFHIYIPVH